MFGTTKIKVERLDDLTIVYFHSATMYKKEYSTRFKSTTVFCVLLCFGCGFVWFFF